MNTRTASIGLLLAGLVDDAGLFPPTALNMPAAIARHRADQRADATMLTHRFLCPASRIDELRAVLVKHDRIRLGLITDRGVDGLDEVLEAIARDHRLELVLLEVPLTKFREPEAGSGTAAAMRALRPVAEHVATYLEPAAVDGIDDLAVDLTERAELAGHCRVGAKLRCGGVRAELFPSPEEVAHFIAACARAGVSFKATAGLHQAVRHRDPETGFVHHGYFNLLLAAAAASTGAPAADLTPLLEIMRRDELTNRMRALGTDEAAAARRVLVSYGSCSTSTPVAQAAEILLSAQERKDRT